MRTRKQYNKYMREWYKKNNIRLRPLKRRYEYKRLQRYRKHIYEYQVLMGGCKRCGILPTEKQNLDFHHLDPNTKLFGLNSAYKHTWKEVLEEIKKCIILCHGCHSIVEPRKKRKI